MTPQETFNAMKNGYSVTITNKEYLKENNMYSDTFTVYCVYSDNIISLIDNQGNIYSDLLVEDISLF